MTNMMKQMPDAEIIRLGMEVARFMKEDAQLTTGWVRKESHFGDTKFNDFKKGS